MDYLQIAAGLTAFTNKVFLFSGKRVGWVIGFIAGILSTFYFFGIGFYVYTVVQIGFSILMLYGYFAKEVTSQKIQASIISLTALISIFVAIVTMNGILTVLESLCALAGLWATFALSKDKHLAGWSLYVFMHFLLTYLTFLKGQYFFSNFQLASGIIALCAIFNLLYKKPST